MVNPDLDRVSTVALAATTLHRAGIEDVSLGVERKPYRARNRLSCEVARLSQREGLATLGPEHST